jgi:hypothetical protein
MHTRTLTALSAALLLSVSGSIFAEPMSKADHKTAQAAISTQYDADKAACKGLAGNAKDICVEEAKGKHNVAKAELDANANPTEKNHYNVRIAQADAAYNVAKEKCDDAAGNTKDVCRKEAKSAHVAAKANAKLSEAKSDNTTKAQEKNAEAQKDANADKQDAAYAVAKEKCDALAGDPKTSCLQDAKAKYGKN